LINDILLQVNQKNLRPREAYRILYGTSRTDRIRRAHFIKLRIVIPEEKGVTAFLAFLFLLPVPLGIVRAVLRRALKEEHKEEKTGSLPLSEKQIIDLIAYKGILVEVKTHEGQKIYIKTI